MREKWHFRIFEMALIVIGIVIGVLGFMIVREILPKFSSPVSPVSVDTPSLLSLPHDKWPEHGLNAVKRGLIWGQCTTCGFPVTKEDVRNGFGESVIASSRGYSWEEFVCYRHMEEANEYSNL